MILRNFNYFGRRVAVEFSEPWRPPTHMLPLYLYLNARPYLRATLVFVQTCQRCSESRSAVEVSNSISLSASVDAIFQKKVL